jgi:pyridoxal phosphate enzyme (YggS family)
VAVSAAATVTADAVARRLAEVRGRIEAAGGDPARVTVVAVTKGFGPDAVVAAGEAGIGDIGENYAQELAAKAAAVGGGVRWHFLGHLQRNKVRRIAHLVHLWQSVDRLEAGEEIARRSAAAGVLVQVNVTGEASKAGCGFEEVPALVARLRGLGLQVRGLMAVGPTPRPGGARAGAAAAEEARPGFRRLVAMADALDLPERSMGMTDDLEVAVTEGSTMVRIGRALFGTRRAGRPGVPDPAHEGN